MTGYQSKKKVAQNKLVVTDLDGHVVRDVRKPKKAAALDEEGMYLVHHTQPAQDKYAPSDPFEKWWYYEGSAPPYKHHDCEEHTKRMCKIAWSNGATGVTQPAREPVGKFAKFTDGVWREVTNGSAGIPLYTTPPQRTWVGLTEEETSGFTQHEMSVVKYVSKVLQEKNT